MLISKDMVVKGCFSQPKIFKIIFSFLGQKIAFKNIYHILEDFSKFDRPFKSTVCWSLKDINIPFSRNWTILAHAKPYNPVNKVCRLCLKEVYFILYKPETASLNKKSEVFGWCKHRYQWTLSNT